MLSRSFRLLVLLGAFVCAYPLLGCSGDKDPSPIGPAGKAQDDSLFDLFGSFATQADSAKSTEKPDTTVRTQGADVVIDTLWASIDKGAPGSLFTLWTRLRNQGNAIADSLTVRFYLSNNATITPSDEELANLPIASLSAGSQDTLEVELALSTRDVSINFFGACVDSVAGEQTTDNNCSLKAQTVRIDVDKEAVTETVDDSTNTTATATDSTATSAEADTSQVEVPTTKEGQYITWSYKGTPSAREVELFTEAVQLWENIILSGHPDGIAINVEFREDLARDCPNALGCAWGEDFKFSNSTEFITGCGIIMLSRQEYRGSYPLLLDRDFRKVAAHEIGHCLGIGIGATWFDQVEYVKGHALVNGREEYRDIAPHFTGPKARQEFQRLAQHQWGDCPYVPLYFDRQGNDPGNERPIHLDGPILWNSVMRGSWPTYYGNVREATVTTLEAAILEDFGYEVDRSAAAEPRLIAGYRKVCDLSCDNVWNSKGRPIGLIGVETLYFPDYPLSFGLDKRDENGHLISNKGYYILRERNGVMRGGDQAEMVHYSDPSIKQENVVHPGATRLPAGKRTADGLSASWCGVGRH